MQVTKVSSKGQVTVPKLIRDILGINEGDKIAFKIEEDRIYVSKFDLEKLRLEH